MKQKVVVLASVLIALVSVSAPAMSQWVAASSPSAGSVNSFTTLGSKLFAGTQENGVLVSNDGGATWTYASQDLTGTHITALATSGRNLFAGTFYAQVYRSTDSGATWKALNTGAYSEIRAFAVVGGSIFAASGLSGVLRSTNQGDTWVRASTGITSNYINAFAYVGKYLYAAGAGIFRSGDNGNSWKPFDAGLSDSESFALATLGDYLYVGTSTGIFVSVEGYPWARTGSVLPPYSVATNSLLSVGDRLFVATFYGVFESTDAGNTWIPINSELSDSTSPCALATDDASLILGTFIGANSGIWHRALSDFGITEGVAAPRMSNSLSIYPNPITHATTITLSAQWSGNTDISIVNEIGVEVAHIFCGELGAGEHAFRWIADNRTCLPGVYECVVRNNSSTEVKPVLIAW